MKLLENICYARRGDKELFLDLYLPEQSEYDFEQVYVSNKRSCDTRDVVCMYQFKKKQ